MGRPFKEVWEEFTQILSVTDIISYVMTTDMRPHFIMIMKFCVKGKYL